MLHIDTAACSHHDGDSEEACRRTVAALTALPDDYRTGLPISDEELRDLPLSTAKAIEIVAFVPLDWLVPDNPTGHCHYLANWTAVKL